MIENRNNANYQQDMTISAAPIAPPKLHVWYDAEGRKFSPIERVCVMYNPESQIVETLTERWPVALAHRHFLGALRPLYTLHCNT
mmetsp:Transcript_19401/g.35085  ORF Transcript_19401/g.35085 Transcript_19401/m.35085 type:complete len:85 (+) Transcript_19401:161-415(+)